jgi:hypothetical protein
MSETGHFRTLAPDNEMSAEPRKTTHAAHRCRTEPAAAGESKQLRARRDPAVRCELQGAQERFAREREDFAASQLKRMLGRS